MIVCNIVSIIMAVHASWVWLHLLSYGAMNRNTSNGLKVGGIPRVVGSITQADTLSRLNRLTDFSFDVAEIRWDRIGTGTASVLSSCRQIEKAGTPVILTIRSSLEGGEWTGDEARRLALYKNALPHGSAVDV